MRITKKCTNFDCQYFNIELEISPQEGQTLTLLCEHCLIGEAQMMFSDLFEIDRSNDELIEAEFDFGKIFNS
ncbi:hypothetical protein [Ammoniphilus resinae]|uniref:Uncharacterized protein n=1 Tax=Ammoniphilus resinae TaxID=861532 RepID=A0ABS4GN16_9BACL|nr:hypothetical protein [Ammoniphilus resinae]MBP1931621.1 hypothetical protein [Ammoniphilus resinae]